MTILIPKRNGAVKRYREKCTAVALNAVRSACAGPFTHPFREFNYATDEAIQPYTVEDTFQWTLDVTFREDDARLKTSDSAENFAVLRHVALNLLKRHPAKPSLKRKRFWGHAG